MADSPNSIDFILYRVQFSPLKLYDKGLLRFRWYRKLAYKLGWWKPLKITYTGDALFSGSEPEKKIGRLV